MEEHLPVVGGRPAGSARTWRRALGPLPPEERRTSVETMRAYEREVAAVGE